MTCQIHNYRMAPGEPCVYCQQASAREASALERERASLKAFRHALGAQQPTLRFFGGRSEQE